MTMSRPSSRVSDIIALLRHVADPLVAATTIATRESDAPDRAAIVEAAATSFDQRLNARTLNALARYARTAAKSDGAERATERLMAIDTMAGRWLGAAMLEALGQHDRAVTAIERMDDLTWGEERALRLAALGRNLLRAGRLQPGWTALRHAAVSAETAQTLGAIGQLMAAGELQSPAPARVTKRIALIGTGTLALWADPLKVALFGAAIRADLFVGEYGQYEQEVLSPESGLARFRPEIVVMALDHRVLGLQDLSPDPDGVVSASVDRLRPLWRACQDRFGATVVQCNVEIPELDPLGGLSSLLPGGRAHILQRVNLALADAAREQNVALFDMNEVAALFGKQRWNDAAMWIAAKQYPAAHAVPFLVRRLTALMRAACGLTAKCVVLDLDNTLWGGVIGEDGLNGIRLGGDPEGEAYTAFHRYLLGLRQRGIPLAVCSKNNEADALSVFREHPESILREGDFAIFLANWDPKPDNLRRVAAQLNVGIDSLVFIDDNPIERHLVRKELPEVEVPELPDDPALYAEALHRTQLFESLTFTEEDRQRADSYRHNAERAAAAAGATDVSAYLAELQMHVELRPFDERNLPRIAQLINKTNQFNLTTRRVSAADVERWMRDPSCYTQFMRLKDRFGDSGLTGVLVAFREADVVRIHTWLLSCRVLGRRIEDAMIASVCAYARAAGARAVVGEYLPTPKNAQVKHVYSKFGFDTVRDDDEGGLYRLPVERAPQPPDSLFELVDATLDAVTATGDARR